MTLFKTAFASAALLAGGLVAATPDTADAQIRVQIGSGGYGGYGNSGFGYGSGYRNNYGGYGSSYGRSGYGNYNSGYGYSGVRSSGYRGYSNNSYGGYGGGHYDYHPTTVVPHGNHYDVVPGHYHYHQGSHGYGY